MMSKGVWSGPTAGLGSDKEINPNSSKKMQNAKKGCSDETKKS